MIFSEDFKNRANLSKKENQRFYRRLKNRYPDNLDAVFEETHDEVFAVTDCLKCANCCKTTSPVFYDKDIERSARGMRLKPGEFTKKFLRLDEDGDYIPNSVPCPFLENNNSCAIYEYRPLACKEYPHTNRRKMHQILDLTFQNTLVCPAVLEITKSIKNKLKQNGYG